MNVPSMSNLNHFVSRSFVVTPGVDNPGPSVHSVVVEGNVGVPVEQVVHVVQHRLPQGVGTEVVAIGERLVVGVCGLLDKPEVGTQDGPQPLSLRVLDFLDPLTKLLVRVLGQPPSTVAGVPQVRDGVLAGHVDVVVPTIEPANVDPILLNGLVGQVVDPGFLGEEGVLADQILDPELALVGPSPVVMVAQHDTNVFGGKGFPEHVVVLLTLIALVATSISGVEDREGAGDVAVDVFEQFDILNVAQLRVAPVCVSQKNNPHFFPFYFHR